MQLPTTIGIDSLKTANQTPMAVNMEYDRPDSTSTRDMDTSHRFREDRPTVQNDEDSGHELPKKKKKKQTDLSMARLLPTFLTGGLSTLAMQPLFQSMMGKRIHPPRLSKLLTYALMGGGVASGVDVMREKLRDVLTKQDAPEYEGGGTYMGAKMGSWVDEGFDKEAVLPLLAGAARVAGGAAGRAGKAVGGVAKRTGKEVAEGALNKIAPKDQYPGTNKEAINWGNWSLESVKPGGATGMLLDAMSGLAKATGKGVAAGGKAVAKGVNKLVSQPPAKPPAEPLAKNSWITAAFGKEAQGDPYGPGRGELNPALLGMSPRAPMASQRAGTLPNPNPSQPPVMLTAGPGSAGGQGARVTTGSPEAPRGGVPPTPTIGAQSGANIATGGSAPISMQAGNAGAAGATSPGIPAQPTPGGTPAAPAAVAGQEGASTAPQRSTLSQTVREDPKWQAKIHKATAKADIAEQKARGREALQRSLGGEMPGSSTWDKIKTFAQSLGGAGGGALAGGTLGSFVPGVGTLAGGILGGLGGAGYGLYKGLTGGRRGMLSGTTPEAKDLQPVKDDKPGGLQMEHLLPLAMMGGGGGGIMFGGGGGMNPVQNLVNMHVMNQLVGRMGGWENLFSNIVPKKQEGTTSSTTGEGARGQAEEPAAQEVNLRRTRADREARARRQQQQQQQPPQEQQQQQPQEQQQPPQEPRRKVPPEARGGEEGATKDVAVPEKDDKGKGKKRPPSEEEKKRKQKSRINKAEEYEDL